MARAITSEELALLRADIQHSKIYLAVEQGSTLVRFRANVISDYDRLANVPYKSTLGSASNALPGMTARASFSFQNWWVRVRKVADTVGKLLPIGETSDFPIPENVYVEVKDQFDLWPKHVRIDGTTVLMDYDVAYSDQHQNCDPVPVMGPHAVKWLTGASVTVAFDASASWVVESTISGYSWAAPGSSAISGGTTATPTITYTAAGQYRVSCTVTAANGKSFTGYRKVFVYSNASPPVSNFALDGCSGDFESGGWNMRLTMWGDAGGIKVNDRTMIILFARDYYGAQEISLGPVADRENILMIGWVDGESIEENPVNGSISFDVHGPAWWMDQMMMFPTGLEDTHRPSIGGDQPTAWTQFRNLTVDKGAWHLLHWRCTATAVMDVYPSGVTTPVSELAAPGASIWRQLVAMTDEPCFVRPCCDRYGRLWLGLDPQMTPWADRAALPVVMDILKSDWRDRLTYQRRSGPASGQVNVSGVIYDWASGEASSRCAAAPGTVFSRVGGINQRERLALASGEQALEIAKLMYARGRLDIETVVMPLAAANRFFDVCPRQYATMTVDYADTVEELSDTYTLIPKRISMGHDPKTGVLTVDLETEPATSSWSLAVYTDCKGLPELTPITLPTLPVGGLPPWTVTNPGQGMGVRNVAMIGNRLAGSRLYPVMPFYDETSGVDLRALAGTVVEFPAATVARFSYPGYLVGAVNADADTLSVEQVSIDPFNAISINFDGYNWLDETAMALVSWTDDLPLCVIYGLARRTLDGKIFLIRIENAWVTGWSLTEVKELDTTDMITESILAPLFTVVQGSDEKDYLVWVLEYLTDPTAAAKWELYRMDLEAYPAGWSRQAINEQIHGFFQLQAPPAIHHQKLWFGYSHSLSEVYATEFSAYFVVYDPVAQRLLQRSPPPPSAPATACPEVVQSAPARGENAVYYRVESWKVGNLRLVLKHYLVSDEEDRIEQIELDDYEYGNDSYLFWAWSDRWAYSVNSEALLTNRRTQPTERLPTLGAFTSEFRPTYLGFAPNVMQRMDDGGGRIWQLVYASGGMQLQGLSLTGLVKRTLPVDVPYALPIVDRPPNGNWLLPMGNLLLVLSGNATDGFDAFLIL